MRRIDTLGSGVRSLTFSGDGRTLAGGGEFDRLWEVASGELRAKLVGDHGGSDEVLFSRDGRRLASGGGDGTVVLWDVTGAHLHEKGRKAEAVWEDLQAKDGATCYRAMWQLSDSAKETVAFLEGRLKPAVAPTTGQLEQLIAALDADKFEERRKASVDLENFGELAESALRTAAKKPASNEAARQYKDLLDKIQERRIRPTAEQLRTVRAVEILERIATAEAKDLLRKWASGAPDANLTREARTALKRLEKRPN
jgi:hypothetical protein